MFLELHLIQSFAPSNLNRDDTGNPKDTDFGGVRRARISSQCIKRAIRLHPVFKATARVEPGIRTRWMTRKLSEKLIAAGKAPEEASAVAAAFAAEFSGKMDGDHTSVLIYLSDRDFEAMARAVLGQWDAAVGTTTAKKVKAEKQASPFAGGLDQLVKEMRGRTTAPDIALFGRMLADKPELNLDAACQVAHAISTHRVNMELDLFTAVDDLLERSEAGAGMMGVTAFNSACFYRYARLDWNQLLQNLDGEVDLARRTVEAFLHASLQAIPTGKQNAFAAQNPPSFALAVCRPNGTGWSLANAFEQPVRPERDGGLLAPSIRALDAYWGRLLAAYGDGSLTPVALLLEDVELVHLREALVPNVNTWIERVLAVLPRE